MKIRHVTFLLLALCHVPYLSISQWQQVSTGLPAGVSVAKLSLVDQNTIWGTGRKTGWAAYTGVIRSTNGGVSWSLDTLRNTGVTALFDICAIDVNTAYIMGYGSALTARGIFKTIDAGKNWTRTTNAFYQTGTFPGGIHFFNPKEGIAFGDPQGGYFEIYTTADSGKTWSRVPSPQIPTPLTEEATYLSSVPFYCHTDSAFWFATTKGRLLRSTDKGFTWSAITVIPPPSTSNFSAFFPAFKDLNRGMAVDYMTGTTAKRTTNGGTTWDSVAVPGRPSSDEVYSIPGTTGGYIVTSSFTGYTGIMYTLNNGATWSVWDTLSRSGVAVSSASYGWTTSPRSTVAYKYTGSPLSVSGETGGVVRGYVLDQNYPNPFNPGTTIGYQLPKPSEIRLSVYDLLGREVSVLVNERTNAGVHEVRFDGSVLSSGVYFYVLRAGDFIQTRSLLLLK